MKKTVILVIFSFMLCVLLGSSASAAQNPQSDQPDNRFFHPTLTPTPLIPGDQGSYPGNNPGKDHLTAIPTQPNIQQPERNPALIIQQPGDRPSDSRSIHSPNYDKNSGEIQVISSPTGAKVYLNNNYKGRTPSSGYLDISDLKPGTYDILIIYSGYDDYSATINVNANQIETINTVLPLTGNVQTTATGFGILTVQSDPAGANIYLDNEYKGISPISLPNIAQGDHTLIIKKDGYSEYSGGIYIMNDKTTAVSATLTLIEVVTTQATEVPMPQQPPPVPTKSGIPFWLLISAPLIGGSCFLMLRRRVH
jgi:hypothetical protein